MAFARFKPALTTSIIVLSIVALAGCGVNASREDKGLGIGALAGGVLGSTIGRGRGRVAATAIGAVIGGIIGSEIGRSLDERDRRLAQEAEYDALERGDSGRPRQWRNPRSGRYGEVVPLRPYKRGGYNCRDYTHTVYIDGRPEVMRGSACRNADGTWRQA